VLRSEENLLNYNMKHIHLQQRKEVKRFMTEKMRFQENSKGQKLCQQEIQPTTKEYN
jgi:hypothetical protein